MSVTTPQEIGRLEYVELREVWAHEAHTFTPWLLGNADVLEEVLGIELEFEEPEHAVGSFSLDLLGRDLTHDVPLIVENQIEQTDHDHLGKLVTYAAGTDARTIVWVAKSFREEHRQALDWLNSQTLEEVRFFGVALRAVRIGSSPAAPLLEVVAKPNDWQKQVRVAAAKQQSDRAEAFAEFWTRVVDELRARAPDIVGPEQRVSESHWLKFASAVKGAVIYGVLGQGELRAELYIDAGDGERNREVLAAFKSHAERLQRDLAEPVAFVDEAGKRVCKILVRRTGKPGVINRPDEHEEAQEWFVTRLAALLHAIDEIGDPTT